MDKMITRFPEQLLEALQIGKDARIHPHDFDIQNVYVAGMGGSGIGGDFTAEWVADECPIPYLVGKGYTVPQFVSRHTLVVISSYSGNTEETLNAFELLANTGAKIVVVASGGRAIAKAKELGLDAIVVPDNWDSPRACLGYSIIQQLFILNYLGFISDKFIADISRAAQSLSNAIDEIKTKAKQTAEQLEGKLPIIYTTEGMESVAVRFRQQLNENAKMLCWHHVIPEMNHNELVGWRDVNEHLAVVYLLNENDYERNLIRVRINQEIIGKYTSTILSLFSEGNSKIERALYLVHLTDWVSYYLAQMRQVDAIEVDVIDYLKGELGKV